MNTRRSAGSLNSLMHFSPKRPTDPQRKEPEVTQQTWTSSSLVVDPGHIRDAAFIARKTLEQHICCRSLGIKALKVVGASWNKWRRRKKIIVKGGIDLPPAHIEPFHTLCIVCVKGQGSCLGRWIYSCNRLQVFNTSQDQWIWLCTSNRKPPWCLGKAGNVQQ